MKTDQRIEIAVKRDGETQSFRVMESKSGFRYIKLLGEAVSLDVLAADPEYAVKAYEAYEHNRPMRCTLKTLVKCTDCGDEQLVCISAELPAYLYRAPRTPEYEQARIDYLNAEYRLTVRCKSDFCRGEYRIIEIVS